jgi:hypothetical protein
MLRLSWNYLGMKLADKVFVMAYEKGRMRKTSKSNKESL